MYFNLFARAKNWVAAAKDWVDAAKDWVAAAKCWVAIAMTFDIPNEHSEPIRPHHASVRD
jgi:hypothetical protein